MKKLTIQEGVSITLETINKNLRHCDYKRTIEIADDYRAYVTGVGIDKKLKQFNLREDEKLFEQRKRLTQAITPDIANSIMNPMNKVGRTPATIIIDWSKGESIEQNKSKLENARNNFYGQEGVNEYLSYRLPELDSTDPNSFILVEFSERYNPLDATSEIPKPYPFEVSSKEAINYKFVNNILQYLIVDTYKVYTNDKGKPYELHKFTLYLDNASYCFEEVVKDDFEMYMNQNPSIIQPIETIFVNENIEVQDGVEYFLVTGNEKKKNQRYFFVQQYTHNIGFIPAFRVGSRPDLVTEGRTKVPLMHAAQPYFEKSIKTMSEFDLSIALHTFPQKIQYTDPCLGEGEGDTRVVCYNGFTPAGSKCKSCNGTGFKYHQSSQDLIQLRMPKEPKDMVSLENVIAYKYPPIDLLKFQKDYALYELRIAAQTAVYNSEVFSKDEVQQTATGKMIDMDAVYDTLQPFAKRYSSIWTGILKSIAAILNLNENFIVYHKFPNDFKMKSFSALLQDLVVANANNAPSHIKNAITNDITRKMYIDQPKEINKIEIKNKYFPFPSKTESEIQFIIVNDLTDSYNKTLYIFFDKIFKEIEYEQNLKELDFYAMTETLQREILDAKVSEYINKIEQKEFDSTAQQFGTVDVSNDIEASEDELKAKANLKGSVGGVQGILQIQQSVVAGTTDRDSALAILEVIYGIDRADAERILGEPKSVI